MYFCYHAFTVKLFLCESIQSSIRDAVEMGELKVSCVTIINTQLILAGVLLCLSCLIISMPDAGCVPTRLSHHSATGARGR